MSTRKGLSSGARTSLWGESHTHSRAITGASAALLQLPGFDASASSPKHFAIAETMLGGVERSRRTAFPLYSGHAMTPERADALVPGARIILPLTATSPDRQAATSYADSRGQIAVLLVFKKGTRALAYSDVERVVAGPFVVVKVRRAADPFWKTPLRIVELEEAPRPGLSSGGSPNTAAPLVFYHGAQRWEGPPEIRPSKTKKVAVHGPGIYLTTHRGTATRYAKGGGTVMRMELSPDLRLLSDVELPVEEMIAFVRAVPRMRKKKEIEEDLIRYATRVKRNVIPANVVLNLMNHYEVGYGEPGQELVRFYVSRGIDGDIVDHVLFGGMEEGEKWLVLFNTDKVLRYERSRV